MGDLLALVGYSLLFLVVVATLVAGWELLLQQSTKARARAAVDTDWFVAPPAPAPAWPDRGVAVAPVATVGTDGAPIGPADSGAVSRANARDDPQPA